MLCFYAFCFQWRCFVVIGRCIFTWEFVLMFTLIRVLDFKRALILFHVLRLQWTYVKKWEQISSLIALLINRLWHWMKCLQFRITCSNVYKVLDDMSFYFKRQAKMFNDMLPLASLNIGNMISLPRKSYQYRSPNRNKHYIGRVWSNLMSMSIRLNKTLFKYNMMPPVYLTMLETYVISIIKATRLCNTFDIL